MDSIKDSSTPDLQKSDAGTFMSAERRLVALKAVWEIESLARNVPVIAQQDDVEAVEIADTLRCIYNRIKTLVDVANCAIDCEASQTEELKAMLA